MKIFIVVLITLFIAGCKTQGPIPYKPPSALGERVYDSAKPIKRVAPVYPRRELMESIEGYVLVEFGVNAKGQAERISVVQSYPEKLFVRTSIKALKLWRFELETEGKRHRNLFEFKTSAKPKEK